MSVEGVVAAVGSVVAGVEGINGAYYGSALEADIPLPPAALIRHESFNLPVKGGVGGGLEQIKHRIRISVYTGAAEPGGGEIQIEQIITRLIAAFRINVGLGGVATLALIEGGGPSDDEILNTKPYLVYPIVVTVLEQTIQTYTL